MRPIETMRPLCRAKCRAVVLNERGVGQIAASENSLEKANPRGPKPAGIFVSTRPAAPYFKTIAVNG
jgi:hypothetical protein